MTVNEAIQEAANHVCGKGRKVIIVCTPSNLTMMITCSCGFQVVALISNETVGPAWALPLLEPLECREALGRYLSDSKFCELPNAQKLTRTTRMGKDTRRRVKKEHQKKLDRFHTYV